MKSYRLYTKIALVSILTITAISCKNTGDSSNKGEAHEDSQKNANAKVSDMPEFRNNKAKEAFTYYIEIKNALVDSDVEKVKEGAEKLSKVLPSTSLKKATTEIMNTDDIEAQRHSFTTITLLIDTIVKETIISGEIFKQYCPMAFDNKGGYWLSTEEKVMNPYFGDRMLHCGSVTDTIQKIK
ncbi:DUF3347 domain-containing protein [Aquimarina sediminis]|uniref:DUF3347 domain-containing protein n=1 Tax=Aquimarina sediminis TaxID=2070536 RepID=UPI000C9FFF75|nr:DUF3347 domain-containing protein [Aquimarina sediminis]